VTDSPITLRPYQAEAVDAVYNHLRTRADSPCVVIPTGGGKTPVMATICRDAVQKWGGRVLVLAHVKELLEQAADKLHTMAPDLWNRIGVYSAGLKSRDTEHPIIVAGIQSVYRRAMELDRFDIILIDEAHMLPPDGEGMYRTFLADAQVVNPNVRLIGLTATPYRMTSGMICGPDNLLNHVCYEVGVRELMMQGYLCQLRSKAGSRKVNTTDLHIRGGEFIAGEVEELMDADDLVRAACREIVQYSQSRRSVLIFAAGVKHAGHVQTMLESMGHECGFVSGETLPFHRADTLDRFQRGDLKYLVNVNVLTTGFDAPNIDCVALLRPTMSPGLYYQMVGRGFRLHPLKPDCLVLDFAGNIMRHGPVDMLTGIAATTRQSGGGAPPMRECPQCAAVNLAAYHVCPDCGHEWPRDETPKHAAQADDAGVMSGEVTEDEHDVRAVYYSLHVKRNAPPDAPRTMRVDYETGWHETQSEWVCVEHTGYARAKADRWWRERCASRMPDTVEEAVELAARGALAVATKIVVRSVAGEKWPRIVRYELGPIPDAADWNDGEIIEDEAAPVEQYSLPPDDDIPF